MEVRVRREVHHVGEVLKQVDNLTGVDWMESRNRRVGVLQDEPTGVLSKTDPSDASVFKAVAVAFVQPRDVYPKVRIIDAAFVIEIVNAVCGKVLVDSLERPLVDATTLPRSPILAFGVLAAPNVKVL